MMDRKSRITFIGTILITGLIIAILGLAAPGPLIGVTAAPLALPAFVFGGSVVIMSVVILAIMKWRGLI